MQALKVLAYRGRLLVANIPSRPIVISDKANATGEIAMPLPPPRVGQYPLYQLLRWDNDRVQNLARLLAEIGYLTNDRFDASLVQFYVPYAGGRFDGEFGLANWGNIRLTRERHRDRGTFLDWARHRRGDDISPTDFVYIWPRDVVAPRVTDPTMRPDIPWTFSCDSTGSWLMAPA
jgi:hypothetical protein